jgi:hypothetical protein
MTFILAKPIFQKVASKTFFLQILGATLSKCLMLTTKVHFLLESDELSPNQEVDVTCVCFRHLTAVHGATNF